MKAKTEVFVFRFSTLFKDRNFKTRASGYF